MKGHAADVVKRFRGFNEDFGYWEAERGAAGIVSSVGMLPPATVTSLQHSFPQSWNNRDPHHTPHLLFTLSHTFLPQSSVGLTHIDQESFMQHLDSCSILLFDSLEGARPPNTPMSSLAQCPDSLHCNAAAPLRLLSTVKLHQHYQTSVRHK